MKRHLALVAYKVGVVYIKFIGTHKQYDAIDVETVDTNYRKRTMEIKPVRTNTDYKAAPKEIAILTESDPAPRTQEGDRLDILSTQVESFEQMIFPMDLPDPVETIEFRMDQ